VRVLGLGGIQDKDIIEKDEEGISSIWGYGLYSKCSTDLF
jgi:hypothetical protein